MTRRLAFSIALAFLAVGGLADAKPAARVRSVSVLNAGVALAQINAYRAQHGLGPVALDPRLTRAAAYVARANVTAGALSHDAGGSFQQRMAMTGLRGGVKAENLGVGTQTFEQTLAMWQGSSAHNVNLLLPVASRIGIAYADTPGNAYGRYWAMVIAQ